MYVKANNNSIIQYPYTVNDLKKDNPSTSFPKELSEATMAEFNMYPVGYEPAPVFDPNTQYIETSAQPSLINGKWLLTKTVVNMTQEQIDARDGRLKAETKDKASKLLTESDFYDLPNTASQIVNIEDIIAYRAILRSIALNPTKDAVFPTKPETIWR